MSLPFISFHVGLALIDDVGESLGCLFEVLALLDVCRSKESGKRMVWIGLPGPGKTSKGSRCAGNGQIVQDLVTAVDGSGLKSVQVAE